MNGYAETCVARARSHRAPLRRARGFTLIELMIVLVILAVILTVAVPGFAELTLTTRLKSYANEVLSSVYLARGEAIKRGVPVTLCVSTDGSTCAGSGDWELGWIVRAQDGTVITWSKDINDNYKLTSSGGHTLTFQPSGAANTASNFKICRLTPTVGNQERTVSMIATGRPVVNTTTTGTCP